MYASVCSCVCDMLFFMCTVYCSMMWGVAGVVMCDVCDVSYVRLYKYYVISHHLYVRTSPFMYEERYLIRYIVKYVQSMLLNHDGILCFSYVSSLAIWRIYVYCKMESHTL